MGSTALLLVKLFAPNAKQMYMVNHLKESPAEEKGHVLEGSARRAHGDIQDLADLCSSKLDAVIILVVLSGPELPCQQFCKGLFQVTFPMCWQLTPSCL